MAASLPPIAPFPPLSVRNGMLPEEWEGCLEGWITITGTYLRSERSQFEKVAADQSLQNFLVSFCREVSTSQPQDIQLETFPWKALRKDVFLLSHRLLCEVRQPPPLLLEWSFLADISSVFARSTNLRKLLEPAWDRNRIKLEGSFSKLKISLTGALESTARDEAELEKTLRRLNSVLFACTETARFFMVGSDFLDALSTSYGSTSSGLRRRLMTTAYLTLKSLLDGVKPNVSLFIDHLYSLRSLAKASGSPPGPNPSLLVETIQATPLLSHMRQRIKGPDAARAKSLIEDLEQMKAASGPRPKNLIRRKIKKGKGRTNGEMTDDEYGHGAMGEMHVHLLSLITQVQDLFPDLGAGFVAKLLDEYGENVEQVTAHLLDDALPPHLKTADRSQPITSSAKPPTKPLAAVKPQEPQLPERRNAFDDDELDTLSVPTSRLHIGRRNHDQTADTLLRDQRNKSSKSAILSALAAFDADDDERDDTYDVSDVGDTVDIAPPTAPDETDADFRGSEETLYTAWRMSPEVFRRDAATRRSSARAGLRSETGMTDETLEGWGVMLSRDPRKQRTLETKYALVSGSGSGGSRQTELRRTAWREGEDSGAEGSEGTDRGGRGGPGRGRGRGRGRGGRDGGDGGPAGASASDSVNPNARRRKEASKGSRANHNRRDQRAKKVGRGGGGMGP